MAVVLLSLGLFAAIEAQSETANIPYQANGVKVGEVTQASAIVWTHLTKISERRNHGYVLHKDDEFEMHNATPGAPGEVRLSPEESRNLKIDLATF